MYTLNVLQLLDFSFFCSLIRSTRLLCDFCSSDQSFVYGFLQIPPRDGHPCLQLYAYHCRSHSGLTPVRVCPCWANKKTARKGCLLISLYIQELLVRQFLQFICHELNFSPHNYLVVCFTNCLNTWYAS